DALALGARAVYGRSTHTAAGIAAAAGRDYDMAEAHFKDAISWYDGHPRFTEDVDARRFYGRMLLRRAAPGDSELAAKVLTEAAEIAAKAGAERHAEMAREQLALATP